MMGKPAGTMEPARWLSGSAGESKGVYITATNALVKFGPHVVPSREAATMQYVLQQCPEIPVPVVYASWTEDHDQNDDGVGYIAMTPMPGKRLDEVWSTLDSAKRKSVMNDYRVILQRLRGLDPSPDTPVRIGALDGDGPAVDGRPIEGGGRRCGGPFSTEAEFNGWLLSRVVHQSDESAGNHHPDSFIFETLKSAMRENHKWRLTHGDMGPHNVLVDENDNGRITAVLGWGSAGWYPEYWEYVKMIQRLPRGCLDFKSYARQLWSVGRVDVFYDIEYLIDQSLGSHIVHGGG